MVNKIKELSEGFERITVTQKKVDQALRLLNIEEIKRRISRIEDSLRDKLSEKMFSDEIEKVYIETAKVKVIAQVLEAANERIQNDVMSKLDFYSNEIKNCREENKKNENDVAKLSRDFMNSRKQDAINKQRNAMHQNVDTDDEKK